MNKNMLTTFALSLIALLAFAVFPQHFTRAQDQTVQGQYAEVNGLNLYYEVYGEGDPLIVLHGGFGGTIDYAALTPLLSQSRQVIAVELQGHGHTADIDRPLSYETMADDVAALIEHLGFENADVMGYSLGGGVALQTAIRHPEAVRKLILISTPYKRTDIYPEFRAGMEAMSADTADQMVGSPMYQFYSSVAPNVDDWASLVGKLGALLSQDYDWTEQVAAMKTPTLIVVGDSDLINPAHAVEMFTLIGGGVPGDFAGMPVSQLAVLPAVSHFTIMSRADLLEPLITPFLDAPLPEAQS